MSLMQRPLVDELLDLVEPILDDSGFELVDLEFKQEGPDWFLRIYIDKNPKNKHGEHRYSAADFGLTEAAIADSLKFFYGEYISLL